METKLYNLFGISMLMLVLCLGFSSATECLTLTEVSVPANVAQDDGTLTVYFNLTNEDACFIPRDNLNWSITSNKEGIWTTPTLSLIENDTTEELSATFTFNSGQSGNIETTIYVIADDDDNDTKVLTDISILPSYSLSISQTTPLTKTQNGTITIKNDGNTELTNIELVTIGVADFTMDFDESGFILVAGDTIDVTVSSTDAEDLDFEEDNTLQIKATSAEVNSSLITLAVSVPFEEYSNEGDLKIKDFEFSVEDGFGDHEDYWYPLDEIKVSFNVDNKGDWDIKDIEIEACLFDKEARECVMDETDMELSEDDFDLDENKDETIKLTFKIDPSDLNEGNEEYIFYVKATGEIDDSNSVYDEDYTSVSDSKEIEIRTKDEFIILDNFHYPETVQCGDQVEITADVWNLWDERIDAEDIYVEVFSKNLGIDEVIDNLDDISALDNEVLSILLNIPEDVEDDKYYIQFKVYYDEDLANKHIYENSEEEEASFLIELVVEGCSVPSMAMVTAILDSESKAGEDLIVKAVITNVGEKTTTYDLNAAGYASWAKSVILDKEILTLESGESKEVLLVFEVREDALGDELFTLEVLSEGALIVQQPVEIVIEKSGFSFLSSITGYSILEDANWTLWGIIILNVILVILIIIVAMRVAKD